MEIYEILKKEIEKLKTKPQWQEIGEVFEIKDGIVKAVGLEGVENFELVEFERTKIKGVAISLEEDFIGILVLGDYSKIREGDIVKREKKLLSFPVGESLIGRIVDPLGEPLDGKGEIKTKNKREIFKIGPGIIEREPIRTPLHTGIKIIDALLPIGRGQRELFLGDPETNKVDFALSIILNQKNEPKRPYCIYVAIGKRENEILRISKFLEKKGALEYTTIICASASLPISFWYLAPFSGCTLGEYFMFEGKDVLIIYDNLSQHAFSWREIALILRRPPSREAFPGDIFYLHSQLLERSAKLSEKMGGGSLTAIPILDTKQGDITGYIPTNLISICDGQIFFDIDLLEKGRIPEINLGLSVSRVGSSAQTEAMRQIAKTLKIEIAQYEELEKFTQFIEEIDVKTKEKLIQGRKILEILSQDKTQIFPFEKEFVILYSATKGFLKNIPLEKIKKFEKELLNFIEIYNPEIFQSIREKGKIDKSLTEKLDEIIFQIKSKYENRGD